MNRVDLSPSWPEQAKALQQRHDHCEVSWPTHSPPLWISLTRHEVPFPDAVDAVRALSQSFTALTLVHRVTQATVRLLPDLVRFMDDEFRGTVDLLCELDVTANDDQMLTPMWAAACEEARQRGVGLFGQGGLEGAPGSPPVVATAPHEAALPLESVCAGRTDGEGVAKVACALIAELGGLAQYVNPAVAQVPEETQRLIDSGCDPRLTRRFRSLADHLDAEDIHAIRPKVVLNVGASPPRLALLEALFERVRNVGGRPLVCVRGSHPELEQVCARRRVKIYEAVGESEQAPTDTVAAVIQVDRMAQGSFRGGFEATFSLQDPQEIEGRLGAARARLSREPELPSSTWLHEVISPTRTLAFTDGTRLSLRDLCCAELWLVDLPESELLLIATDPLALERVTSRMALGPAESSPSLRAAQAAGHRVSTWHGFRFSRVGRSISASRLFPAPAVLRRGPLTILGLACTTLQNHAAALVVDGKVVAAVQQERLTRRKQQGWHPPGRRGMTMVNDPAIDAAQARPDASIAEVLSIAGIGMDDVDIVAYNGMPARFLPTYSLEAQAEMPETVIDGAEVFVPHHLAHAASAYRVSGAQGGAVFTVDGRGERETAAFFDVDGGDLIRRWDVLCGRDALIGGVFEYFTTILGFGHYGQGSTMGLAPYGEPTFDVSRHLSARSFDDHDIHDRGIIEAFGHLRRHRLDPMDKAHLDLAASVQRALEDLVVTLIRDGLGAPTSQAPLSLAGGVALNCAMNQRIRQDCGLPSLFVQPAAHDAGTALGAALEAHYRLTGQAQVEPMTHAYLGRSYSDGQIIDALQAFGLPFETRADIPRDVAELIAAGHVICWFQGGMEFGPRALGARSILADPRQQAIKERVNVLKGRQWWRPFGPSILAGREADWFETPMHSPFMLFTLPVLEDRQAEIPAVLHVDGTTRPQSVTAHDAPRYHAMLSHFEHLTSVPMVLNTSFNTGHEPIVCSPQNAISTFLQLGADYLAIGDQLVRRASCAP